MSFADNRPLLWCDVCGKMAPPAMNGHARTEQDIRDESADFGWASYTLATSTYDLCTKACAVKFVRDIEKYTNQET